MDDAKRDHSRHMSTPRSTTPYDVIVVGAGHAGCEAAHAAARLGCRTLLITIDLDRLAHMSCNPSIGGPAKGHLVREIDALGGLMGRITDQTFIQIRLLNESKGPAVQALRAQADKRLYAAAMKRALEHTPGLDLRQALVERIVPLQPADGSPARFAVITHTGRRYDGRALVLTTGTFLRGRAVTGEAVWAAGRAGEAPADALAGDLAGLGFPLIRLKTGTPPRIDARTIDFSLCEPQDGSPTPCYFGHYAPYGPAEPPEPWIAGAPSPVYPVAAMPAWRPQLPCFLIHTTDAFHEIVRRNLHRAPLFTGVIEGVGPRYCPSIEDKIVRFQDKPAHGMFLEPEGWHTTEVYVQGCNTSLPEDVQWAMLRSIPALQRVELMRSGYAIEYDAIAAGELTATLAARRLDGLFLAGQINGTTGYEEAAAQGLLAGINAACWLQRRAPLILRRDEAYLGVLVDDLVTKALHEPYRMFTSRAEHRLLLRHDTADLRLAPHAARLGLIDPQHAARVEQRRAALGRVRAALEQQRIYPSAAVNARLRERGIAELLHETTAALLLRRPDVCYADVRSLTELPDEAPHIIAQAETEARYGGYLERQEREVARTQRMEQHPVPDDLDVARIAGLRLEARQVLARVRPRTVGQASRLAGVNPADIAVLLVAIRRHEQQRAAARATAPEPGP